MPASGRRKRSWAEAAIVWLAIAVGSVAGCTAGHQWSKTHVYTVGKAVARGESRAKMVVGTWIASALAGAVVLGLGAEFGIRARRRATQLPVEEGTEPADPAERTWVESLAILLASAIGFVAGSSGALLLVKAFAHVFAPKGESWPFLAVGGLLLGAIVGALGFKHLAATWLAKRGRHQASGK